MSHFIWVEVPSVPFGFDGDARKVDAAYYLEAARNIRWGLTHDQARFAGSNLSETVARLCETVAGALEIKSKLITDLDIPPRVFHALDREGITTTDELRALPEYKVLAIRNIGLTGLRQIREALG